MNLNLLLLKLLTLKKWNIIVGCIYKHPSMDVGDFNNNFLNNILDKVSKEQKFVLLSGDFNISLLNYNYHRPTNINS